MASNQIYIILKMDDDLIVGHAIRSGEIDSSIIDRLFEENTEKTKEKEKYSNDIEAKSPFPESFSDLSKSFTQTMFMYQSSVSEIIKFAPIITSAMQARKIKEVVDQHGQKVDDLSSAKKQVYLLPDHAAFAVNGHTEQARSFREGAKHLPKISTIGIISSFDAIMAELLRVIFKTRPELIFNSEREIKFSELMSHDTIASVRESIVSNEIESVLRLSHHEQFFWMEKKFGMKLREGLDVWSDFIELCERRNLLTHTGGVVSHQYIKNCRKYGKQTKYSVGSRLDVDLSYFLNATNIVSEIGMKLIHTMWRKFSPSDRDDADTDLNNFGLNLISNGHFKLAEKILEFGVKQNAHSSDLIKRMMVVNLANAKKLGGEKDQCDRTLASFDWSATSSKFQICVAAVKNDFSEVRRLLGLGADVIEITPSDFRSWPVFRDARKDLGVQSAFEAVFGEPLLRTAAVLTDIEKDCASSIDAKEDSMQRQ